MASGALGNASGSAPNNNAVVVVMMIDRKTQLWPMQNLDLVQT
jgi:hypothetical protein